MVHAVIAEFDAGDATFNRGGLIRAMRPGGDAPLEAYYATAYVDYAAKVLQRNGEFVFHIA